MPHKYPYRLMTPGPVPLAPEVLEIMAQPMLHHRTPGFQTRFENCLKKLPALFKTQQPVLILTSTGSGAMEAAITNILSPGDEALFIVSGKFGERWRDMGQRYDLKNHVLDVNWGQSVDPDEVANLLQKNKNIKAVFCQACETSTATLHPIEQLGKVIKSQSQALFVVDAITAMAATPIEMDNWNIDVIVAGSQKAFMLPTGVSFISLSEKAWKAYEKSQIKKFYFDLKAELLANQKGQSFFSTPVLHILGLELVLRRFDGANCDLQIKRCLALRDSLIEAAHIYGLKIFSKAPSPSVTALMVPEGILGEKLRDHLEEKYNLVVMGGQDQLKGKILRVGHLGYITDEDQVALVELLGQSLMDFSYTAVDENKVRQAVAKVKNILLQNPLPEPMPS